MAERRRKVRAHEVLGPVELLEKKTLKIRGVDSRIAVMALEPRCPAPIGRRRHPKCIAVELMAGPARLHVSLTSRPAVKVTEHGVALGDLRVDFGERCETVTIAGRTLEFGSTASPRSYELGEDGHLIGVAL